MTSSQRKSFNTAGKKVLAGISKDAKFESDLLKTNEDIGPQSLYGGREVRPPTPTPPYKRLWLVSQLCGTAISSLSLDVPPFQQCRWIFAVFSLSKVEKNR